MRTSWWRLWTGLLSAVLLAGIAGAQPGAMGRGGPGGPPPQPFKEVIKDCERIEGLFDFYWNKKTGQVFLALTPDHFGPEYLVATTLNEGTGRGRYIAPMLWPHLPVYFKRTYETVQVVRPNTRMTAQEGTPIHRAMEAARSDSILLTLRPASEPYPEENGDSKGKAKADKKETPQAEPAREPREPRRAPRGGRPGGRWLDGGADNSPASLLMVDESDDDAAADGTDGTEAEDAEADEAAADGDGEDAAEAETKEPAPVVPGTILIDASPLFLGGLVSLSSMSITPFGMSMGGGADSNSSFITNLQSFPENCNVEVTVNVGGDPMAMLMGGGGSPDPRSSIIKLVYSLTSLPTDGYTPRYSDERVGYFLTLRQDWSDDTVDTRTVRYINRWKLEKQDPEAALSEPVEPIVFWIENTVPLEYRDAVREGIEVWQTAFEAAGFKNGIIARQMPDDADWDPADVRYNVVRWFVAPGSAFAIGPSRANPYTGQLYDADIGFSAEMAAFRARHYQNVIDPLQQILAERRKAQQMGIVLPPALFELPQANADPAGYIAQQEQRALEAAYHAEHTGGLHQCNFAHEMADHAAALYHICLAEERFVPGSIEEREFINQYITSVTAHEVGHTIGLRHNYKASTFHDLEHLSIDAAKQAGLTGSVMDYTGINLVPRGQPQGEYFQTKLGPYDIHAVKYGYMVVPGASTADEELAVLADLAAQGARRGLAYATDEDAAGWTAAMDPTTQYWDLSSDPIGYYRNQLQVGRELLGRMEWKLSDPGTRFPAYRRMFGYALGTWSSALTNVPRYIGGIVHVRHRVGDPDGDLPYTPVPAARQREALQFLIDNYWTKDAIRFRPELLRKLALDRHQELDQPLISGGRRDYPVHTTVLNLQRSPLLWIYDSMVLHRIQDTPTLLPPGSDVLTMAELFGAVRGAIWQEAFEKSHADSFRRNLQREHLQQVTTLYLEGGSWYPEDALTLARLDLVTLQKALQDAIAAPGLDGITRAHYQESLERIQETLNATVQKGGKFPLMGLFMF